MSQNEPIGKQIAGLREKHKLPAGFVIMHLSQIATVEKAIREQRETIVEAGNALGPFLVAAEGNLVRAAIRAFQRYEEARDHSAEVDGAARRLVESIKQGLTSEINSTSPEVVRPIMTALRELNEIVNPTHGNN